MNVLGIRNILFGKNPTAPLALLLLAFPVLHADTPKKSAPAPKAPAAKSSAPAKPASGGASTAHPSGATTTSHGPTTTSHGPTTTASHPTTTTSHPTTTTAGHSTTTAGHPATSTKTATTATTHGTLPTPKGTTSIQGRNGTTATVRPGGKVATFNDPKRGMQVHNSLSGNRQVVVERTDHTRIVVERGGHGYVQHPYMYHGHEYAVRSYYYGGVYYHGYYGRYYYGGYYLNPYYPAYYYSPYYYGWVANPWVSPAPYAWGWGVNPWYGYYGAYFTPYPVYAGPAFWLTDYLISTSLAAAYQAQAAQAAALSNPAPLSPEVKQLISDEVRAQVTLEYNEAQTGATGEPNAAVSSIQQSFADGKPHVFVAGHDLDVVDAGGNECALSEGDAIQLRTRPAADGQPATLAVLASKGGRECPKGDLVSVNLPDLQEMQNHMRETIDQGMQELQKKQGTGGLPAAPSSAKAAPKESAMALNAPPPPPENEVKSEISQQSQEADRAEKEAGLPVAAAPAAAAPAPAPAPAAPVNIETGQTIEQVTAALGPPVKTVTLGVKKIYVYKDMKITFKDGKVTDVQ